MNKTAIITGLTGQVASYLTELLISKGYKVIGCRRRSANPNYENIEHLLNNPNLVIEEMEMTDYSSVSSVILKHKPDEIYNLAAQSFVASSFNSPHYVFEVNTLGVLHILETLRLNKLDTKFLQYSTSEVFGKNYDTRSTSPHLLCDLGQLQDMFEKYQDENTEPHPQSPYGIAKLAAQQLVRLYRESYGLNCCSVISFNMESPRRGKEFVTRKITDYIGKLTQNNNHSSAVDFPKLRLGNLDAYRDWTHVKDSVECHHLILQQDKLEEYVVSTGYTHTIKEFCEVAFKLVGLNYEDYVVIDPQFYRPSEVDYLRGDSTKAKTNLGWEPKISFEDLVKEMVEKDIERNKDGTN